MHSVRQACRPKHQVLVLKCYPRFQKGVQVVKPNSSELSYLLYYASTRRSKLQKVGAFLEKRAARDVWRQKLGNVQVTMQLLAALIEKLPRDLPLYASSVLTILDTVLQHSNDIAMVEETIPTFQVFCSHQDATALSADTEYINQYRHVVRKYASFASPAAHSNMTPPMALRWRNVGLQAIKSVVGSEALGADWSRQLSIVIPVILQSLYHNGDPGLILLRQRAMSSESHEREHTRRRRMSIATVQTVDTVDGDPESASGTAADADKMAEIEAQVLALRCLEKIFTPSSNRVQIRLATALVLEFIVTRNPPRKAINVNSKNERQGDNSNWATDLLEVIVNWAPVQDRFVVLVTLVEALAERPLVDGQLDPQLTLVYMIEWLLSSPINLIGLSVMDVLIALLRYIILLLHLGEGGVKVVPPPSKTGFAHPLALASQTDEVAASSTTVSVNIEDAASRPSSGSMRQELLHLLQSSVANLANHVYYTDQVSDMIKTIVSRIKPVSATTTTATTATATTNVSDHESEKTAEESVVLDTYFSTATAQIIALKAVKDTLLVANTKHIAPGSSAGTAPGAGTDSRHRVPVQAWEGTQWLLRDADREVKHAYVDALLCWLKLETNESDLRAPAEPLKVAKKRERDISDGAETLVRRALPAPGQENKLAAPEVSRFLQHLHFNVFEIATDPSVSEADILLVHLLMVHLVERLGVNATRYGLPVMMKLQSHFLDASSSSSPLKAGSLVHGYLSAIVERFTLEGTKVGREILNEVVRRKKNGLWLSKVQLPPLPATHILAEQALNTNDSNAAQTNKAAYTPFTSLAELVSQIEIAYSQTYLSPPSSPASSPSAGQAHATTSQARQPQTTQLPQHIKEQMLSPWSREACLASIEQERTRSSSLAGSKTGSAAVRNHLGITPGKNGTASSPTGTDSSHSKWRPVSASAAAVTRGESRKDRRQSLTEISHPRSPTTASSSKDSTVRVNELRRVLSVMNNSNVRHPSPLRGHSRLGSDAGASSAESMVTDTFSTSDAGFSSVGPAGTAGAVLEKVQLTHTQPHTDTSAAGPEDSIPPVPPIPTISSTIPTPTSSIRQPRKQTASGSSSKRRESRSRSRPRSKSRTPSTSRRASSPQPSTRSRKHSKSAADAQGEDKWDPSLTRNPILLRSVSQSRRAEVDRLLEGIAAPGEREHGFDAERVSADDGTDNMPRQHASHDGVRNILASTRSSSTRRGIGPPPY